ncbi:hypothetical protein EJ05DRAFT_507300 [Pseudovirgaria hyperparasitica]|uniref:Nucleoporin Nup120/160 n=1 Tax=Pseudovirgaria hyperparasitica TaxID=470096 RepID=A0A6A6WI39_9PEZI|nr:uncharacterized protein EJ05DRAFT_507300 [Pseudovirgaria hyperparasitica]KAF2761656.1 hypothetical protein EJ05DRAFT_507300 [Pseudovirgaria hyperparasitica]
MSTTPASHLYKEIRLDLEQFQRHSTIAITLPSSNAASFLSRSQHKRTILNENFVEQDENAFARRHLASEGSVFFRSLNKYPRSFLWRLLDDRKVLEIRSVDPTRDISRAKSREKEGTHPEAFLTFLLAFPTAIKPFGIALADLEDRDAIAVFAITTSNEIYTITLAKTFFSKPEASEQDPSEWCKIHTPTSFSFRYPYRLVAVSALELWVSLHDGGLLRLTRKPGDDGTVWVETPFGEKGWGSSFRGLIPWKSESTIKFGTHDLIGNSAADLAVSPDKDHLWTVCLNHTLKAWNLNTGKVGVQADLLDEDLKELQKTGQYMFGATQPQLLQVISVPAPQGSDLYYVVTYSPKQHRFKFWGVMNADNPELGLRDIQPEFSFIPPVDELMNTTVWNLEEFHVEASTGWLNARIWIRARSGPSSKAYTTTFNLFAPSRELQESWHDEWATVDPGPLTASNLRLNPTIPSNAASKHLNSTFGCSDRWTDFLLFPGRYSLPTLETALCIYRSGIAHSDSGNGSSNVKHPLKERMCRAVASAVTFKKDVEGTSDYATFEHDLDLQWHTFFDLVQDLHKRRGECLRLSYDTATSSPWLVLSDYVAPIRLNSKVEILIENTRLLRLASESRKPPPDSLNSALDDVDSIRMSMLLAAAARFRRRLPAQFQSRLRTAVDREVHEQPFLSITERLQAFEALCELDPEINDDDALQLEQSLSFLGDQKPEFYSQVLTLFSESQTGELRGKAVNQTGMKLLLRVSQEMVETQIEILLDLLVLTMYMAYYWEPEDIPGFDANYVFASILTIFREHVLLRWLYKTTIVDPSSNAVESNLMWLQMSSGAFDIRIPPGDPLQHISYWARVWTFDPFGTFEFTDLTEDVMVQLLRAKQYDHAATFQKFLGCSPWSFYLRGKLLLSAGSYTLAAVNFKKAAPGLSNQQLSIGTFDRMGMIPVSDRGLFCHGMLQFTAHLMNLFEAAKAYSFVVDFAKIALQQPPVLPTNDTHGDRAGILSRLFTASIKTSCFEDAYSALVRQKDPALRKANLTTLVTSMTTQSQSAALLRLPLATLSTEVDTVLESLCHKTLNISSGPPYHKILYAYRISRDDFRGAASILYERLQRLQSSSTSTDEALTQGYLILINTLASVSPDQAWIFAEGKVEDGGIFGGGSARLGKAREAPKRRILTLDDIRREYEAELDRQSALENGRFAFGEEPEPMELM